MQQDRRVCSLTTYDLAHMIVFARNEQQSAPTITSPREYPSAPHRRRARHSPAPHYQPAFSEADDHRLPVAQATRAAFLRAIRKTAKPSRHLRSSVHASLKPSSASASLYSSLSSHRLLTAFQQVWSTWRGQNPKPKIRSSTSAKARSPAPIWAPSPRLPASYVFSNNQTAYPSSALSSRREDEVSSVRTAPWQGQHPEYSSSAIGLGLLGVHDDLKPAPRPARKWRTRSKQGLSGTIRWADLGELREDPELIDLGRGHMPERRHQPNETAPPTDQDRPKPHNGTFGIAGSSGLLSPIPPLLATDPAISTVGKNDQDAPSNWVLFYGSHVQDDGQAENGIFAVDVGSVVSDASSDAAPGPFSRPAQPVAAPATGGVPAGSSNANPVHFFSLEAPKDTASPQSFHYWLSNLGTDKELPVSGTPGSNSGASGNDVGSAASIWGPNPLVNPKDATAFNQAATSPGTASGADKVENAAPPPASQASQAPTAAQAPDQKSAPSPSPLQPETPAASPPPSPALSPAASAAPTSASAASVPTETKPAELPASVSASVSAPVPTSETRPFAPRPFPSRSVSGVSSLPSHSAPTNGTTVPPAPGGGGAKADAHENKHVTAIVLGTFAGAAFVAGLGVYLYRQRQGQRDGRTDDDFASVHSGSSGGSGGGGGDRYTDASGVLARVWSERRRRDMLNTADLEKGHTEFGSPSPFDDPVEYGDIGSGKGKALPARPGPARSVISTIRSVPRGLAGNGMMLPMLPDLEDSPRTRMQQLTSLAQAVAPPPPCIPAQKRVPVPPVGSLHGNSRSGTLSSEPEDGLSSGEQSMYHSTYTEQDHSRRSTDSAQPLSGSEVAAVHGDLVARRPRSSSDMERYASKQSDRDSTSSGQTGKVSHISYPFLSAMHRGQSIASVDSPRAKDDLAIRSPSSSRNRAGLGSKNSRLLRNLRSTSSPMIPQDERLGVEHPAPSPVLGSRSSDRTASYSSKHEGATAAALETLRNAAFPLPPTRASAEGGSQLGSEAAAASHDSSAANRSGAQRTPSLAGIGAGIRYGVARHFVSLLAGPVLARRDADSTSGRGGAGPAAAASHADGGGGGAAEGMRPPPSPMNFHSPLFPWDPSGAFASPDVRGVGGTPQPPTIRAVGGHAAVGQVQAVGSRKRPAIRGSSSAASADDEDGSRAKRQRSFRLHVTNSD
ncbi:hypothetical protein OC844_007245 [Tilletia horrida]|nr:hypothetical protein OC844_007245 [Tilletia horrida]